MTILTVEQIRSERRRLISSIKKKIAPHLRDSGYGGVLTSRVRIWTPTDRTGKLRTPFTIPGFGLASCVTADGVGDASYAMLIVSDFRDMPIEHLIMIERWAKRTFPSAG